MNIFEETRIIYPDPEKGPFAVISLRKGYTNSQIIDHFEKSGYEIEDICEDEQDTTVTVIL